MTKAITFLAAVVLSTGCLANQGEELATNRAAVQERPAFPLKLARIADESEGLCGADAWLDEIAYSNCVDAGGTSCNKTACYPKSDKPSVAGNELAFVEVSYASIIGPEIAGIIGPEIAGIIGPELPSLAAFTNMSRNYRIKVLDSYGRTILSKSSKHISFAADLDAIRSSVKSVSGADPKTVRFYLGY